ncbi:SGNH/GDSL hydrolase family protein [Aliiglaciecola sp. M165]|uniref:SGNH/GDSL hydrolase family protein n=1 Tax=Aliiglaciecola sp. M165 TaxID=2593649 RepID=UPI00117C0082|nr:SGNH/GDSL hydrolase family protein [Aliiglaciecola sp. M165]TRY32458.1 SGNH/GDSL hydrolase family protein [Aliiglaciecola sp. M165]
MKVWLFRAIAVFIPFLFFILLELGLRFAGYGQSYPLFIPNPDAPDYLLPRPDIVKRYFPNASDVPSVTIEANFFRAEKPKNGLRFFVQGGSTAAGFPYGLGASIAGMLDHRLKQSFPDNYVEIINTSLAAVNSYTNLDLVDEIIAQQPDAVLIYMGHNEFLGIMGVGSNYTAASSAATTLLFLKLKEYRTFQLIQSLYHSLKVAFIEEKNQESETTVQANFAASRTFMAKVAKHKTIPQDSKLFSAGVAQFEQNLSLILEKYQGAGIPVFISTLVSNLLDQRPFSSLPTPSNLENALRQLSEQITTQSVDNVLLEQTAKSVSITDSADAHFQLGRIFNALGDSTKAKLFLTQAKDLDLLRFRAPEAINSIIRNHALRYGAILVNAQQRFEQQSPLGVVGNNLMLEHLHPNVEGYFLLSDAFYQSMSMSKAISFKQEITPNVAWKQRMLLQAEEYYGFAKALQLKSDYPFVDEPQLLKLPAPQNWQQQLGKDLFDKKLNWLSMVQHAQTNYQAERNSSQVIKTQLMLADALPYEARLNVQAADMLMKTGQTARASTYIQRSKWAEEDK